MEGATIVSSYIFSFRGNKDRTLSADEEAAWGQWFEKIGASIADFGSRVGSTSVVGAGRSADVLTGYTLVTADDLEAATALAEGCPALRQGGGVEVGELIPM
jgi:hypothetical protein